MNTKHQKKAPKKRDIAEQKYKEAFIKHFNCAEKDFEMKASWENGPMLALYKDEVYKIDNSSDVSKWVKELLTCEDAAMHISLHLWIEVAEEVHLESDFTVLFGSQLKSKKEVELVKKIYNDSNNAERPISAFWEMLYEQDDYNLYAKAIVCAAQTYNMEEELEMLLVENGESEMNQLERGMFTTVCLQDEEDCDDDEEFFYIYSVDPIQWEMD